MKILAQNVRRFNLSSRAKEVMRVIQDTNIGMFCLLETRVTVENQSSIVDRMGNKQKWLYNFCSDPSGRIIVGWDP